MAGRRRPTRHALYELCVQNASMAVSMLRAIRGGEPKILAEDFSGTGAVSRAWCDTVPGGGAIAVDHDPGVIRVAGRHPRIRAVCTDVMRGPRTRADVVFVGNFSIGEIHTRTALVKYLSRSRTRLRDQGVFVCDTYGGATSMTLGSMQRTRTLADGRRVVYTWQQRMADPLTGMVENAIHFRVFRDRDLEYELTDAFVYHWRLWSIAELREAMREAGFAETDVYSQLPDAVDHTGVPHAKPLEYAAELDETYVVCVAAKK